MTDRSRFLVGTPLGTHEELKEAAREAGASVSMYVCVLIEAHLEARRRLRRDLPNKSDKSTSEP
jgi:alpha-acetolactate decarboxylase